MMCRTRTRHTSAFVNLSRIGAEVEGRRRFRIGGGSNDDGREIDEFQKGLPCLHSNDGIIQRIKMFVCWKMWAICMCHDCLFVMFVESIDL